ncbi:hypothetical protein OG311_20285 [Streptomyces sp. NBC_01343]|uniref:hypothetical protein n=1 Tax=Streptomyces sp. NBC_01343 TaxID=2903832 RepID=UPI002E12101E|nr:hypothetical protein OG311_20285 [Streptomyces sp. NBC_01343]
MRRPLSGRIIRSCADTWYHVGCSRLIAPGLSPASGAKSATYTSPVTFGRSPASVMTAPPYECPTSSTGPSICRTILRVRSPSSATP